MPKLSADNRVLYLQILWQHFQQKAKTHREMSSSEYHVASKWLDRGLPLFVILRAIDDFKGKPRRLEAFENGVNEAAQYHFKAVGSLTELPEAGPLEESK